jgi:arylsulfatase A-like enzyme
VSQEPAPQQRPNVLVLMADQHAAHMLSGAGTAHVSTPALDALAASGTTFTRAYTTFPLCVPARASMVTGRYPHQLGIYGNAGDGDSVAHDPRSLGHLLRAQGYDTAFAGKWHARAPSASPSDGFDVIAPFGDAGLAQTAASWLRSRADQERPFALVVSLDDPHSICEFARRQPMPYGQVSPQPSPRELPPLPANHGPYAYEPEALRHEQARAAAAYGTSNYTADDWREYRRAYAELVQRADSHVSTVLEALAASGLAQNTVVIYTSDHGDGDASHRWNQKTALFEETCRVPLIVRDPRLQGRQPAQVSALVSVGLDLLPTCLSIAGAENSRPSRASSPWSSMSGGNVVTLLTDTASARDEIVVQTTFQRPEGAGTSGRAVVTGRYKYVVYGWGAYREQLFDVVDDPGETRNLAVESAFDPVLEEHRERLLRWCQNTGDGTFLKRLVIPAGTPQRVRDRIFATPY